MAGYGATFGCNSSSVRMLGRSHRCLHTLFLCSRTSVSGCMFYVVLPPLPLPLPPPPPPLPPITFPMEIPHSRAACPVAPLLAWPTRMAFPSCFPVCYGDALRFGFFEACNLTFCFFFAKSPKTRNLNNSDSLNIEHFRNPENIRKILGIFMNFRKSRFCDHWFSHFAVF